MAQNKLDRFGPTALTNTLTTNILNPADAGTGHVGYTPTASYLVLKRIRIVNKTAGAVSFTLYIGGTGGNVAGSEFLGIAQSVAANSFYEWFGNRRLDAADFLVGGASAATSLTIEGDIEIGAV